jgi:CheY-like chemotaxis protein
MDIVITDQVMPVMDGWDLLRKIRQNWPDMPVLLYSARPPVRPLDCPESLAFDACLLKPATTSELLQHLQKLLR